jgi:hypothetical protein
MKYREFLEKAVDSYDGKWFCPICRKLKSGHRGNHFGTFHIRKWSKKPPALKQKVIDRFLMLVLIDDAEKAGVKVTEPILHNLIFLGQQLGLPFSYRDWRWLNDDEWESNLIFRYELPKAVSF